jgi:predicted aspartyl protease
LRKCFKFAKENSSSLGIVYRPIAKVGLRDAGGDLFELSVLVDSGADITILSKRIGDIMGVNVEQGEAKVFRGIVGEIIAYVHKIPLSINGKEIETRVAFALSEVPNLLGRLDIFKNFEISFRKEEDFCFSD